MLFNVLQAFRALWVLDRAGSTIQAPGREGWRSIRGTFVSLLKREEERLLATLEKRSWCLGTPLSAALQRGSQARISSRARLLVSAHCGSLV